MEQLIWDAADKARFEAFVDKSSGNCWLWTGAKNLMGYGQFSLNNRQQRAHRVAFVMGGGTIPDGGIICHKCDNPACVRPDHLFVGTAKSNVDDMRQKSRGAVGDGATHNAKLSAEDAAEIRQRYADGETQSALAKAFGVSPAAVSLLILGQTWAAGPDATGRIAAYLDSQPKGRLLCLPGVGFLRKQGNGLWRYSDEPRGQINSRDLATEIQSIRDADALKHCRRIADGMRVYDGALQAASGLTVLSTPATPATEAR
jgi:hypothetical protein